MPGKLKTGITRYACEHGGYGIAKFLTRKQPKILMYHRFSDGIENNKVSSKVFEKQLLEIKTKFNPIPLQQLVDSVKSGKKCPDNSIVITIDDGYKDFYSIAYPLLKKYAIPATVYITSNFVDGKIWLWPDKVSYILQNTRKDKLELDNTVLDAGLSLTTEQGKTQAWETIINYCLTLNEDERKNTIANIALKLDVRIPECPIPEYAAMSWDDARDIHKNGIEIGAHTCNHPVLSRLDKNQLEHEIADCKSHIEGSLNTTIKSFCYPNGQPFDYNEETKMLIKANGYNNATVAFHDHKNHEDLYEIRRNGTGNSFYEFRKSIYGVTRISDKLTNR